MRAILRDKAFARRIARAGCVDALGIVRLTGRMTSARPRSNQERVSAWRDRSGRPGFADCYVRPWQAVGGCTARGHALPESRRPSLSLPNDRA